MGSDVCGCVDGFDGSNDFGGGFDGSDGVDADGVDGVDGFDGTEGSRVSFDGLVWRALVASHSPYQALCFAFVQMPFLVQCC